LASSIGLDGTRERLVWSRCILIFDNHPDSLRLVFSATKIHTSTFPAASLADAVSDPCGVCDIESVDSNVLATDRSFFLRRGNSKEASQDLADSQWQRHAARASVRV
jgi:hypothetical protein